MVDAREMEREVLRERGLHTLLEQGVVDPLDLLQNGLFAESMELLRLVQIGLLSCLPINPDIRLTAEAVLAQLPV